MVGTLAGVRSDGEKQPSMPDYVYEPGEPPHFEDVDRRLTFVDGNTGEFLDFAGEGWPTTDEEAEMVLPRPPVSSTVAIDWYYVYRYEGLSIRKALLRTMDTILGADEPDEDEPDGP